MHDRLWQTRRSAGFLPATLLLMLLVAACSGDGPTSPEDTTPDPLPDPGSEPFLVLLDVPGSTESRAFNVTDQGFVVGQFRDGATGHILPVRWLWNGEYEELAPASATLGWAWGVSADGRTVSGMVELDGEARGAFRWTEEGGFENLGSLGGVATMDFAGISADGSVATGAVRMTDDRVQPIVWRQGGTIDTLGILPDGDAAYGAGVSADGEVVVGLSRVVPGVNRWRAIRWTATEGLMELPGLVQDGFTRADGISGNGQRIIGMARTESNTGFAVTWDGTAGPVLLPQIGPHLPRSWARSASWDGSVIVGVGSVDGLNATARALRWTDDVGVEDLTDAWSHLIPEGWLLRDALGVSPDGRWVAGTAVSGGDEQAFLLFTGD
jgi:uncharacterized membrane protein